MTTAELLVESPKTKLRIEIETLIEKNGGHISPHKVVDWARAHKSSELYKGFQWNDKKAAASYRLAQARQMIAVHVEVVAATGHKTRAFVSIGKHRVPEEGYSSLRDVLDDPIEKRILLDQARRALVRWREQYSVLEELTEVFEVIDKEVATAS